MAKKKALSQLNKGPRDTDWGRLDDLIDWYERFKPQAGKVIQVRFETKELLLHCIATEIPNEYRYRGRILQRITE